MSPKFIKTLLLLSTILPSIAGFSQNADADRAELLSFYALEAKYIGLKNGDTILDVGAGSGAINAMYAVLRSSLHQVLTDVDPKVLNQKKIRASYKSIFKDYGSNNLYSFDWILHKDDTLPLADASFSKILCRRSLHEFKRPEAMLKEIHRVLRDTGTLVVIEAIPVKPGEKDPNCKFELLSPDRLVAVLGGNGFVLAGRKEETMSFDNGRSMCVLSFKKAPTNDTRPNP